MSDSYAKYLQEYDEITQKLADPAVFNDQKKYKALSQKHRRLEELTKIIQEIQTLEKTLRNNREIIQNAEKKPANSQPNEDQELAQIAEEENQKISLRLKELKGRFENLTLPRDPDDEKDVILEIRAGAGGDEAGLFAAELFRMYQSYAENQGFGLNLYHTNKNDLGGIKEIIAEISGAGAYGLLKHESGVHRVQRVPETEKNGRVHTSTATVAILPKAQEADLAIKTEEVKVDTFRSSGPGGQSVNTTDSAIRLTHLPTGLVVTCQDEKSQHKNKAKAFSILRSRLLQAQKEKQQAEVADLRSSQIGTGDRSEKIRTYNFPQDRITDHRLKQNFHEIEKILAGELDPIIKALRQAELAQKKQHAQKDN